MILRIWAFRTYSLFEKARETLLCLFETLLETLARTVCRLRLFWRVEGDLVTTG